jgi:uncharacterized membrane protein
MEFLQQHWLTSHSISGMIHFISATLGLFLGLGILFLQPGSKLHKLAGYIFIPILLTVNLSALFIHEMGMQFGPFHYIIFASLGSLIYGFRPFLIKVERDDKLRMHIRGMVGAALGLWAAFFAELVARTPALIKMLLSLGDNPFWILTIEGFAFVFLFSFIIRKVTRYQMKRLNLTEK